MSSNSPVNPARPGLTAAEFHTVVNRYELNPDLSADVRRLEQQVHQGLVRVADLAAQLARGALKGPRLPQLFLPLVPDVQAVHTAVRGFQSRLYRARKRASNAVLAPLFGGETSATFALAGLAMRIVADVGRIASALAWDTWERKVEADHAEGADDQADAEDDDLYEGRGQADADRVALEEEMAMPSNDVDVPGALASAAAAAQLRQLFGSGFAFPASVPLLHDMRLELMELDGPGEQGPAPTDDDDAKMVDSPPVTIDARIYALVAAKSEASGWSQRAIALELGCSQASVNKSKAWKSLLAQRGANKIQQEEKSERPTGGKRKRRPK